MYLKYKIGEFMFKKIGLATALLVSASTAFAGNVNVGGVVWDPDYVNDSNTTRDFFATTSFSQWYSTTKDAEGTLSSYDSAVTIGSVLGTVDADDTDSGASGFYLSGGGIINRINDPDPAHDFCISCELTFAFGGLSLNLDGSFTTGTDAWLNVFVNDVNFDLSFDSASDISDIIEGTPWLTGFFTSAELTASSSLVNGALTSIASINGGLAANRFDPSDIGVFGNNIFGSQFTGPDLSARYATSGTGQVLGNTVPNPGSIALFGLAIAGMALARRNAKK